MFESLYLSYRGIMYHRALGILGDHGLAEDAVHEAFIRIAKHLPRFEVISGDECRYLCLTIVKNAALNILRDRGISVPLPEDLPVISVDVSLGIDLDNAIGALEENHRQVVILRLRYGFSTEETARLLGIKSGTVRSRLNRARKLLQDVLRERNYQNTQIIKRGVENSDAVY